MYSVCNRLPISIDCHRRAFCVPVMNFAKASHVSKPQSSESWGIVAAFGRYGPFASDWAREAGPEVPSAPDQGRPRSANPLWAQAV